MPYLPTTTTTSVGGILANQPRIDFTGGGCGSLLLEGSRTNVIEQSEYFEGSPWIKNSTLVVTSNNAISPDGTQNATRVNKAGSGSRIGVEIPLTSGQEYTLSFYMKNNGGNTSLATTFDGQSAGVAYTITDDWARYEFTFTATTTETSQIRLFNGGVDIDAHIWGAQMEQGSYTTSYIPTYGTSVTRAADVCGDAGNSSTFNSSEGVLFFDGLFFESIIGNIISLSNGLTATGSVSFRTDSTNRYKFFVGSYNYLTPFNEYDVTERHKIALVWSLTSFKVFIDGVKKHDVSISFTPSASFSRLNLSNYQGTGKIVNGKAKQVLTFNTALSDAECIELTTI